MIPMSLLLVVVVVFEDFSRSLSGELRGKARGFASSELVVVGAAHLVRPAITVSLGEPYAALRE